jgi:hypothetical protein
MYHYLLHIFFLAVFRALFLYYTGFYFPHHSCVDLLALHFSLSLTKTDSLWALCLILPLPVSFITLPPFIHFISHAEAPVPHVFFLSFSLPIFYSTSVGTMWSATVPFILVIFEHSPSSQPTSGIPKKKSKYEWMNSPRTNTFIGN